MTRYLSGLCVAGLGLCGGGWLILAAVAFGGEGGDGGEGGVAGRVNLATGAALVLVGCVTAVAWAVAWRRRLRRVGVLAVPFPPVSRREARRNRRRLARDVRRAARLAAPAPGYGGDEYGGPQYGGTGHDGASAADVLGELRSLLGPLLTAAAANQGPAQLPWPQSLPVWPAPPGPGQRLADQRLADQWLADQWLAGQWPAEVPPSAQWRPRRRPAQQVPGPSLEQAGPPQPPPCPGPRAAEAADDDELGRIADGEEAWW